MLKNLFLFISFTLLNFRKDIYGHDGKMAAKLF